MRKRILEISHEESPPTPVLPERKARADLHPGIDQATLAYIRKSTGLEPVFQPESHSDNSEITEKQKAFLRAYANSGGLTKQALRESGASRTELDEWNTQTPWKKAFKEAQDDWVEELRKAAMLRATSKSDVLLIFLLKALRPDVYDEDVRKQQYTGLASNKDAIPVRATLIRDNVINVGLSSESADELRAILETETAQDAEKAKEDSKP
jgi:hypothetical protein